MTYREQTVLAVVPARGGSKGIPGKNLCTVGPLSLIGWTAKTILKLPWLDAAVVSTDDAAIAAEATRHGLDVPFVRPAVLATDTATALDTWRHAWLESERHYSRRFDLAILLQPTTPLRRANDVERTLRAMVEGGHGTAASVSRVPGHFAPEKCLTVDDRGIIAYWHRDGAAITARQTIPVYFYRNGVSYAATREALVERGEIIGADCRAVPIDDYVVNIDDPIELEIARMLYRRSRRSRAPRPDPVFER